MPPRRRIPKTPVEISEDQGGLIDVSVDNTGGPDAGQRSTHVTLTEHPEGYFPEPRPEQPLPTAEVVEATRQAAITKNRRKGQLGKHSPLERDGTYLAVRPGDILPGFGIVTKFGLVDAQVYAQELEAKRLAGQPIDNNTPIRQTEKAKNSKTKDDRKAGEPTRPNVEEVVGQIAEKRDETLAATSAAAIKASGVTEKPVEAEAKEPEALEPTRESNVPDQLSDHEKLLVLKVADKAGFLPKTNEEGTIARGLLSHTHDDHNLGVYNHLQETYLRQIKVYMKKQKVDEEGNLLFDENEQPITYSLSESKVFAADAMRSRVMEIVDFYHKAFVDAQALRQIDAFIKECPNPKATLAEEIEQYGVDPRNFHTLVRFAHLKAVRETGENNLPYDPFQTHENRDEDQAISNKNKTLGDKYTAKEIDPEVQELINQWLSTTTIKQARPLIKEALEDIHYEGHFWKWVIGEMRGGYKRIADEALREYSQLAS